MTTATKTQPAIETAYNDYMQAYGNARPIDQNDGEILAALGASADLANTRMIVTRGFKSGFTFYKVGDVYPAKPADRAHVIKLCKTAYILPEEEYKRGEAYTAIKDKVTRVKKLYQDLQTARDNKTKTARNVDAARLDLATAEGLHSDAVQNLATLETVILKALE